MSTLILFTEDMEEAIKEIKSLSGTVSQQYSCNILIANFHDTFDASILLRSTTTFPETLDEISKFTVGAWKEAIEERSLKTQETKSIRWNSKNHQAPGKVKEGITTPTSSYMRGSIALGLVVVSGEPANLKFSDDEKQKVLTEVLRANEFLATTEPAANITFVYEIHFVDIPKGTKVPGTSLTASPSGTVFNNKLYCFHRDGSNNDKLWYNVFDGSQWEGEKLVEDTKTSSSPSVAIFNGILYCACQYNGDLWYNGFDGNRWGGNKQVPNTKVASYPSTLVFNNKLYCFHQGLGNGDFWYNVFDGSKWEGDKLVPNTLISFGPAATVYNNKIYCFFQGSKNGELWYTSFDGSNWEANKKMEDTIIVNGPSVTVFQNELYCFLQGTDNKLYFNAFDGNKWRGNIMIADVNLSYGPSSTTFEDSLYCFYQGSDNNKELWYRSFENLSYESKYNSYEYIWTSPAMKELGYPSGYNGYVDFTNHLRESLKTNWGYIAFFTKYPQNHFAYAGGVRLCMQYDNDGWGPDNIHSVFAHETCHIFGAADEYGSCNCNSSGFYGVSNGNCVNCTSNQVSCLMDKNDLTLCGYSKGQIGWLPQNGIFVFHQGGGNNNELWYSVFDGESWWRDRRVPNASISWGPSVVMFNEKLYCFYRSTTEDEIRYNFFDGKNWQGPWKVDLTRSSNGPSCVVFNGKLYCFYNSGNKLSYNAFNGTEWDGVKDVSKTSISFAPSSTIFNDKIYCFHQGGGDNGQLWYNTFDGKDWVGDKQIANVGLSQNPSAIVFNQKLYCFHKGGGDNNYELWCLTFGSNDKKVDDTSISAGPSTTVFNNKIYCFHQGSNNNGQLWYNVYDGNYWEGDKLVVNVGMSSFPSAIYASF